MEIEITQSNRPKVGDVTRRWCFKCGKHRDLKFADVTPVRNRKRAVIAAPCPRCGYVHVFNVAYEY